MVRTLHLPPTERDGQYGPDFLHGLDLDLERVHVRRSRTWLPRLATVSIIFAVLAVVAVVLMVSLQPAAVRYSAHDSGIAQEVQIHTLELEGSHDSGIAKAAQTRDAEFQIAHDSGVAQALRER
jgi:hypothetical protein